VVSYVAWSALSGAADGFTAYRGLVRDTNISGRLRANILTVRMNVKEFLITGNASEKERYSEAWDRMKKLVGEAKKDIRDPGRAAIIADIEKEAEEYNTTFEKVVGYTMARNEKVEKSLNVEGAFMEKGLTDVMQSARRDDEMDATYYSGLALRQLLMARMYIARFLHTNDKSEADRVNAEFSNLRENLRKLGKFMDHPRRLKILKSVRERGDVYIRTFDEVRQIIEERNALIIGKLDQVGPSIAGKAEEINLSVLTEQDELGPKLALSGSRSILTISVSAFVALIMGIVIALLIVRSMKKGIANAVNVTKAVAEGHLPADIQIIGRDEIGDLLGNMKNMVEVLRERAENVRRIAEGDLTVDMKALSDMDILGQSLSLMVDAARERAEMVRQVAKGDLSVNMKMLSDRDVLGQSLLD